MMTAKYRVWDVFQNKMIPLTLEEGFLSEDLIEENDWIVMQFSGLLAKHGKEIYTGDIISCDNCTPGRHKNYEVKFDDGMFYIDRPFHNFSRTPLAWFSEEAHTDYHGNIYENPELTK